LKFQIRIFYDLDKSLIFQYNKKILAFKFNNANNNGKIKIEIQ